MLNIQLENPWFTPAFVSSALQSIAYMLEPGRMDHWLSAYPELDSQAGRSLKIGVIPAGNIPLVGFHDFLCVLLTGNIYVAKLSSKDEVLPKCLAGLLLEIEPQFAPQILFEEGNLKQVDAMIATGSNNSARYFEYYFGRQPHLIRKNRNAAAVLDGQESAGELDMLADDIFMYFGLGCRNVSKLYVPAGYDLTGLMPSFEKYSFARNHNKYMNNYEYNRAIFLLNQAPHFDNGFLLVREDATIPSPIGVLNYAFYHSTAELASDLQNQQDHLQCIVTHLSLPLETVPFGQAQYPEPWDYADQVDTVRFLLDLKGKVSLP